MKILIISPGYLPITGSHGGAIENLINIYLKHNETIKDDITIYTVKNSANGYDSQIYQHTTFRTIDMTRLSFRLAQKGINFINRFYDYKVKKNYIRLVIKDLKKRQEENNYDVIVFENGQNFIRYFKNEITTKSRLVLHLHNDYLNKDTKYASDIFDSFDEIWTVSEYIKKRVDEIKLLNDKVKVLYNTVDYSLFKKKSSSDEKMKLKNSLGILDSDFVYLYVGRIMEAKGTLELVKAFISLNESYKNIKMLVVGGNKSLNNVDSYIEKIHELAKNNENVIFTGQVNNRDLYKYYQISNVQVIPSKWNEAFGLITLEGVASDLPIICTNSGGIPEIMGDNCIYAKVDNLEENLKNGMELLFNDETKRRELTRNYSDIISKFSVESYCTNFNNLLKK